MSAAPTPTSRLEEMRRKCNEFHARNPEVWNLFVQFANEKIRLGYQHFGAKAIMERVRWETAKGDGTPMLKVNDMFTAFYARRFAREFPRHADFFRTRKQRSAERPATGQPAPNRFQLR